MSVDADKDRKEEALREKELGNEKYKKGLLEEALRHYEKAWELDNANPTSLINKAAVLFEREQYEECIEKCHEAIEIGREHRVDFKVIARAFERIGNAYVKLDNLEEAVNFYNKSLTEHRTAKILSRLQETEKLKERREKEAYHNPELADKERDAGNELFKKGEFAAAIDHYTEAIKRDDRDPRSYSNRAACYTKLMAYNEAAKDCESCIQLDPLFIKGYLRKAALQFLRKEYDRCLETCAAAKEHDAENKHATQITGQMMRCYSALRSQQTDGSPQSCEEAMKRIASDPELQQILSDPVMHQILQQMQENPEAIAEHLRNPQVAANIQKLMSAGIVRTA